MNDHLTSTKAREVFACIRRRKRLSKQDLKQLLGLPTSTLTRLLDELVAQGLIHEVGYGESTGGRKPILYEVNPHYGVVLGLDIARTSSRLVLCDLHGRKLASESWKMDERMTPERLSQLVIESGRNMLDVHNLPEKSVLGMGIGAVGPLDRASGTIRNPIHFPAAGWQDVEICSMLKRAFQIPVFLDNGANAALLAEYWLDTTNRAEHWLYVHAGVGIRSAMMTGGQIVYGAVDMEGSVGQMIIQTDGRSPYRAGGNYGSWESYVSIHALEHTARSMLKQGRSSIMKSWTSDWDQLDFAILEQALQEGDALAREIFTQAAVYFGIGLANLLNILHPEQVVLGGPLFAGNAIFFQQATQIAIEKTYHYPDYQVVFQLSSLAEDAVAIGAAVLALNEIFS